MADINIYGKLVNQTTDGRLADTGQIFDPEILGDDNKAKNQHDINIDVLGRISVLETSGGGTVEVLAFDGIEETLGTDDAGNANIDNSYTGGSADGTPVYLDNVKLVFDAENKRFVVKEVTEVDEETGDDIGFVWWGGWDPAKLAYPHPSAYVAALSNQNRALFFNRSNQTLYRLENGVLMQISTGEGGSVDLSGINTQISGINTQLSEIEATLYPVTLTLSASPSLTEYTGSNVSVNVVLNRYLKQKGSNIPSSAITMASLQDTTSGQVPVSSSKENPLTDLTATVKGYGVHTFKTAVKVGEKTYEASATVRLELPIYIGFGNPAAMNSGNLAEWFAEFDKVGVKTNPAGEYTYTNAADGNNLWICIPKAVDDSHGNIQNKVTSSGFAVPMTDAGAITIDLGTWHCYYSSSRINAGEMTFKIS